MPSDDFNEFIDDAMEAAREGAEALKRFIGPFGSLLNPQSSRATQAEIDELKERLKRADRVLDSALDTIQLKSQQLQTAESERDALREQIDTLTGKHESTEGNA